MFSEILSLFSSSYSAESLQQKLLRGQNIRKTLNSELQKLCNPTLNSTLKKSAADDYFDDLIGLEMPAVTGEELLPDSTPYVATSVAAILKMLAVLDPTRDDVLCDVGAGLFRIPILVHLLTGMQTIGVEMDTNLTSQADVIIKRFSLNAVNLIEGDASQADLSAATIFAFNLPFEDITFKRFLRQVQSYQKPITIYPFCWHYYFWDIPWLQPINYGGSEDYYFISRS